VGAQLFASQLQQFGQVVELGEVEVGTALHEAVPQQVRGEVVAGGLNGRRNLVEDDSAGVAEGEDAADVLLPLDDPQDDRFLGVAPVPDEGVFRGFDPDRGGVERTPLESDGDVGIGRQERGEHGRQPPLGVGAGQPVHVIGGARRFEARADPGFPRGSGVGDVEVGGMLDRPGDRGAFRPAWRLRDGGPPHLRTERESPQTSLTAVSVIDHADELDAAEFVHLEIHRDQVGFGVESIPDELGDRADRILLAGEPQQMVGFGLDMHSHDLTISERAAQLPEFPRRRCRDRRILFPAHAGRGGSRPGSFSAVGQGPGGGQRSPDPSACLSGFGPPFQRHQFDHPQSASADGLDVSGPRLRFPPGTQVGDGDAYFVRPEPRLHREPPAGSSAAGVQDGVGGQFAGHELRQVHRLMPVRHEADEPPDLRQLIERPGEDAVRSGHPFFVSAGAVFTGARMRLPPAVVERFEHAVPPQNLCRFPRVART